MNDLGTIRFFLQNQNSAKLANIEGIIKSGKTVGGQYNGQLKQNKSDLQNTTQSQL